MFGKILGKIIIITKWKIKYGSKYHHKHHTWDYNKQHDSSFLHSSLTIFNLHYNTLEQLWGGFKFIIIMILINVYSLKNEKKTNDVFKYASMGNLNILPTWCFNMILQLLTLFYEIIFLFINGSIYIILSYFW